MRCLYIVPLCSSSLQVCQPLSVLGLFGLEGSNGSHVWIHPP